MSDLEVLWLRPSTGENVSLRRERIANHLRDMGVDVTICNASRLDAFGAIQTGLRGDYDAILGNVRMGLYLGYPLARTLRVPFFGDVSDHIEKIANLPDPLFKLLYHYEWWVLDRSESSFFAETRSYEEARERGLDPILVRNAVDYNTFAEPDESVVSRARTILQDNGVDIDGPIAIYIGSMVPYYYLEEIIKAAPMTQDWKFVFVGEEKGVPISELAAEHDNVYYLGAFEYDMMPGFLAHADCGICLCDFEQPLKVLEYGAAGLPTLGYDGRLRKNFTEDELLFLDPNPETLSETFHYLSERPEKATEYGENLRKRAKEHSWESVAETYYEQIQAVSPQSVLHEQRNRSD